MTRRDWNLIIGECEEFRRQLIYTVGRQKKPSFRTERKKRKSKKSPGARTAWRNRRPDRGFRAIRRSGGAGLVSLGPLSFTRFRHIHVSFARSLQVRGLSTYKFTHGNFVPFCAPISKRSVYFSGYAVKSSKTLRGKNVKLPRTRSNRTVQRKTYRDIPFKYSLCIGSMQKKSPSRFVEIVF